MAGSAVIDEPLPLVKMCAGCGCTKSLKDFTRRKRTAKAGGWRPLRASRCRACMNKLAAIWRLAHPGYQAEKSRAWRARRITTNTET